MCSFYYDLKMSERILLLCAARQRKKERKGVLPLPKIEMVKRNTGSYELLPDHRLFMITSICYAITGADRFSVTHTSSAHIIYMSPGIMHKRAALAYRPKMHTGLGCSSRGVSPASAPIPHGYYPETAIFCHAPRPRHCPLALLKGVTVMVNGALVPIIVYGRFANNAPYPN